MGWLAVWILILRQHENFKYFFGKELTSICKYRRFGRKTLWPKAKCPAENVYNTHCTSYNI